MPAPEGIERLSLFFASAPTRQGLLARRALARPSPDDGELAHRLIRQLEEESAAVEQIESAVVPTIWRAHELMDLGAAEGHCARVMEWILALQGQPGAFSHGCSRIRHGHRVCEHFISGFFSPAPPEQRLAPVMLPNGKVFRAEPAARFTISCLALRAALRGQCGNRAAVQRHLASLHQLQEQWSDWSGYFAGDAIVSGIHALALSALSQQLRERLSSLIAAHQAPDGTWPTADLFHTLEALLALDTTAARGAIRRAVPTLLSRQRIDGTFGSTAQQERALIALRSLIWAEQEG
ncbi:MAG: hypothetical protein ACJ8AV_00090 [Gemmatimonadales bacterium]